MTLTAYCDSCGKKIKVGQEYAGKKVKCLHCGHVLILPKRESFFSDPHTEFAKLSEGRDHEESGDGADAEPLDKRDSAAPAVPGHPYVPDADAAQVDVAVSPVVDEHPHAVDMVRGLAFGAGFWLAASPFLLLVGLVLLALARVFLR